MRGRFAAVGLALVLVCTSCGGGGHAERRAVSRYIDDVNSIEVGLRKPLLQLAKSNRSFSSKQIHKTQARSARARTTLERLDRRLRELQPPHAAQELHRRLLALVDAEVDIAREVDGLARFLPQLDAAIARVSPAQRRLNVALKGAHSRGAQAAALDAYANALDGPLRTLRTLESPRVTAPVLTGEVQTLSRVSTSARALAAALRANALARVTALQRQFLEAARSSQTVPAQQARIAAVQDYDRRVRALSKLAARVQRERDRLQRSLK